MFGEQTFQGVIKAEWGHGEMVTLAQSDRRAYYKGRSGPRHGQMDDQMDDQDMVCDECKPLSWGLLVWWSGHLLPSAGTKQGQGS